MTEAFKQEILKQIEANFAGINSKNFFAAALCRFNLVRLGRNIPLSVQAGEITPAEAKELQQIITNNKG